VTEDQCIEALRIHRQQVYNELHAYYQDLIPPGGSISRSELLARLEMLAQHPLGG
jgi:hypothetical protein